MIAFARGCLEFVVVWLLGSLGLYFAFAPRFSVPGPIWASVIGGFLVAAGWGLFRNALIARGQASLIRDSLAGAIPVPGRPYAAIGKAVAQLPLLTPFQHRACVLYSYELSEKRTVRVRTSKGMRTDSQKIVFLSGLAMTNWGVQTKGGMVRVCGFPVPDQFEEQPIDCSSNFSRIRAFCDETQFERVGKWEIGKMLNFAGLVLSETSGPVRQDLWFEGADEIVASRASLQPCRLIEQAIAVDEPVCVIGKFDLQQQGLVNDLNHGGLQVLAGDADQAMRHLRQTTWVYLFFALVSILMGTLGSFGLLSLREQSLIANEPVIDSAQLLVAAFEADDWDAFSALLADGVSPDSRDSVGRPLLLAAIARRKPNAIETLLTAGADVNAAQTGWNQRPLEAAFDRNETELVQRLKEQGAVGDYVDKSAGQPLSEELGELESLMQQYTEAMDIANSELMQSISTDWPTDFLESVGRGLYKDTKPSTWTRIVGYRREELATFLAEGNLRSGGLERYVVTARLQGGKWKLQRVYFDDRYSFSFEP